MLYSKYMSESQIQNISSFWHDIKYVVTVFYFCRAVYSHTIQFCEWTPSEVCCCFDIKTMTHKSSGLRTLSHGWGNVSQIEMRYLCLFLFLFCLLSVIILSLLCLLNVVWDTIHECPCLRHTVLSAFTQHSTSNTHFTFWNDDIACACFFDYDIKTV